MYWVLTVCYTGKPFYLRYIILSVLFLCSYIKVVLTQWERIYMLCGDLRLDLVSELVPLGCDPHKYWGPLFVQGDTF